MAAVNVSEHLSKIHGLQTLSPQRGGWASHFGGGKVWPCFSLSVDQATTANTAWLAAAVSPALNCLMKSPAKVCAAGGGVTTLVGRLSPKFLLLLQRRMAMLSVWLLAWVMVRVSPVKV
jgi:hypothetical protein